MEFTVYLIAGEPVSYSGENTGYKIEDNAVLNVWTAEGQVLYGPAGWSHIEFPKPPRAGWPKGL
jgi:hypothetical protein